MEVRFFSDVQAAKYLGLRPSTLRKWRLTDGQFGPRARKLGKSVRYSVDDLENWVRAQPDFGKTDVETFIERGRVSTTEEVS